VEIQMKLVDLHTHTTASDGTFEPADSVRRAKEKGLAAIAITDHDTVAGIPEAIAEGQRCQVEVLPGIEISSVDKGQDIHVLGYFMDYENEEFLEQLNKLRNVRDQRNEMLIQNLQKLGIDIELEEVVSRKKMAAGNIGRPHIAEVLVEKGLVNSLEEAFTKYLGKEGKAYANPPRITPEEAIDLIKRAGGVAVLAHPGLYEDDELIKRLIHHGLDGIEALHSDHTPEQEEQYQKLAEVNQMIATAGSDFHGERAGIFFHGDLGNRTASYSVVRQLLKKRKNDH
jgi:predicted metal-dependent phosphoesterase TrpH